MNRILIVTTFVALLVSGFLVPSTAHALADLEITSMSVVGAARVGTCNRVSFTVRNNGDEFSGNATLDMFLATYPNGTSNQNRAERNFFIGPLQGGGQSTFTINNVEFKAAGGATLQAVVDSTQETQESNENNNIRTGSTNVSGACPGAGPPPNTGGGTNACDVEATFVSPSGSTIPRNSTYTYELRFTNKGSGGCKPFRVNLSRSNGRRCSGYGSRIGGSGAWASIPALAPNASATARIGERRTPSSGTVCIKPGFSPHGFNDANNANHRIEKVVTYQ